MEEEEEEEAVLLPAAAYHGAEGGARQSGRGELSSSKHREEKTEHAGAAGRSVKVEV